MTSETISSAAVAGPTGTNRLLAAGQRADAAAHRDTFGPIPLPRPGFDALVHELEASGLTGRGGAAFAVWRKFAATGSGSRRSPVVIANGAEGEPRSWKDAVLLEHAPHLVLDGLVLAASAIGAKRVYLYAGAAGLAAAQRAAAERRDPVRIDFVEAPESFIAGEASAVVNAIQNDDPRPTDRRRRLSEAGLDGRPTLLHNVETLAQLGLVARFGSRWFRSVGSPSEPGTRLVTVTGDVGREGVFEVASDAPVDEILARCGVARDGVSAVLVGGYHGAWVPGSGLSVRLTSEDLARYGAQAGAGVLYVIGRERCGLAETASIVGYLAGESAGQCGPCVFGLPAMARRFGDLASGVAAQESAAELVRLSDLIVGRGSCHHPDGTARLIRSALAVFAPDVRAHAAGRCVRHAGA